MKDVKYEGFSLQNEKGQSMSASLLHFIKKSPNAYHAAENIREALLSEGFTELFEGEKWSLAPNADYFVSRNGSSVIAFRTSDEDFDGFMMMAAHLDSPSFKLKADPFLSGTYTRIAVERYGGMNLWSWLDRPLSFAGRIVCRIGERIESRLINLDRDAFIIPSVAVHQARDINTGFTLSPATDLLPLYAVGKQDETLFSLLSELSGVPAEDILSHDLYLYARDSGTHFGRSNELIAAPRLDDLASANAIFRGFLKASPCGSVPVAVFLNSEEVGSLSREGADGSFLSDTLRRISDSLGGDGSDYLCRLANSFLVSADNAHALHPNRPELSDKVSAPILNGGVVIKHTASQAYTTDAVSEAIFAEICRKADVPVQHYENRPDAVGGSTLGRLVFHHVSVPAVDVGLAQLSMHSAYETMGEKDIGYLEAAAEAFFQSSLHAVKDGVYEL